VTLQFNLCYVHLVREWWILSTIIRHRKKGVQESMLSICCIKDGRTGSFLYFSCILSWIGDEFQALKYFEQLFEDLDQICSLPLSLGLEELLQFLVDFQQSQPDLFARAQLQVRIIIWFYTKRLVGSKEPPFVEVSVPHTQDILHGFFWGQTTLTWVALSRLLLMVMVKGGPVL
jgi:hypothetical protein